MNEQNDIRIEKVSNGYIVYEDYGHSQNSCSPHTIGTRKVFETTEQLNKYITTNFKIKKHE